MGFIVEYAKSGRSGCRCCRERIPQGSLRLGELLKSTRHDGMDPHWFHPPCFVLKHPTVSLHQIQYFIQLPPQDQLIITRCLAGESFAPSLTKVPPSSSGLKPALEPIKNSGLFFVEYAKSNQSRCISCEGRIVKGEVRISQKDFHSQAAKRIPGGSLDRWHHVECFQSNRHLLEFSNGAGTIPGIEMLSSSDQDMLLQKLPQLDNPSSFMDNPLNGHQDDVGVENGGSKKRGGIWSGEEKENGGKLVAQVKEQEGLLETMSTQLGQHFHLQDKREELAEILRHNGQDVPVTAEKMVERIADMMIFGVLERCSVCKGQFVLRPGMGGYYCSGYISDFAKCTKKEKVPKRLPFSTPDELRSNPIFENYEFIPRTRLFLPRQPRDEVPRKLPKLDKLPLLHCKFTISDHLSPNLSAEIRDKLLEFGATIVPRIGKQISAIISAPSEVDLMTRRIEWAQMNSIPVLSGDFIHSISTVDFEIEIAMKKHLLSTWICNFPSSTTTQGMSATMLPGQSAADTTGSTSSTPLATITSQYFN